MPVPATTTLTGAQETEMKKLVLGALALSTVGWNFAAIANEPATKPSTEHCDDKGHAGHAAEPHGCEHGKPAGH